MQALHPPSARDAPTSPATDRRAAGLAHQTTLRRALAERDITGRALAHALGVHPNSVYAWTAGRSVPQPATALRIAHLLGVDVSQLWPRLGTTALLAACTDAQSPASVDPQPVVQLPVRTLAVDEVLDLPAGRDPRWRALARCATTNDPDMWWPHHGQPDTKARRECAACPVIAECRDTFLADPWPDTPGVVAGVRGHQLLPAAARHPQPPQVSA